MVGEVAWVVGRAPPLQPTVEYLRLEGCSETGCDWGQARNALVKGGGHWW